jgi:YVTN family beta-propeller protein
MKKNIYIISVLLFSSTLIYCCNETNSGQYCTGLPPLNVEVKINILDSIASISKKSSDTVISSITSEDVDSLEFDNLEKIARITEKVNNPKSVIISPNGKYAYINNLEGMNTMIIDAESFETLDIIEHTGKPVEFAFTHNGRYVWISYFRLLEKGYPREFGVERNYRYPSVVVVYDTLEKALTKRIEVGIIPKVITVSPDEKLVFVANWNSASISVIDADSFQVIKTIKVGAIPRGIRFTPDGKFAYICNFGASTISRINIDDLEVDLTLNNVGYKPRDIVIRNDGKYAYYTNFGDGYIRKLDIEENKVVDKIKIGSQPRTLCITNNNKYIFAVNYSSGTISVINADNFELINEYRADIGAVGVALSPCMRYLWVTNQSTGSIIVFKVNYK